MKLGDIRKLTVLAGAGVSVDAGLPTARNLLEHVINVRVSELTVKEELVHLTDQARPDTTDANDYLRFETVLQTVEDLYDPSLEILDFLDRIHAPGALHLRLARTATEGALLITTNFDDLLEQALKDLGRQPWTLDAHTQHLSDTPAAAVPVIHLHGTRFAHAGGKRYGAVGVTAVQATIRRIARASAGGIFPPPARALIGSAINGHQLLVVGYSGADDLDIVPTLFEVRPDKLFWLHHESGNIREISIPAVTDASSGRDRLLRHLAENGVGVHVLVGPTIEWLQELGVSDFQSASSRPIDWERSIHAWSNRMESIDPGGWAFAGLLYLNLRRQRAALQCLTRSKASSVSTWTPSRRLIEIGYCHLLDTPIRPVDAANAAREALVALTDFEIRGDARLAERRDSNSRQRARLLLGRSLDIQGLEEDAIETLGNLLQDTPDDDPFWPVVASWYARALRKPEQARTEALGLLSKAADAFQAAGDISQLLDVRQALGWTYEMLGRVADAVRAYREAERLSWLLGDIERRFAASLMLGACNLQAGNYSAAEKELLSALTRVKDAGAELEDEVHAWGFLTRAAIETNQLAAAEEYADRSFTAARSYTLPFASNALCDKAEIRLMQGDRDGAVELLDKASQLEEGTALARFQLLILSHAANSQVVAAEEIVAALQPFDVRPVQTLTSLAATICRMVRPSPALAPVVKAAQAASNLTGNVSYARLYSQWLLAAESVQ